MKNPELNSVSEASVSEMADSDATVSLLGHTLKLLSGRGVYFPISRTLAVTDLHLGKDVVFRRQRVPVPQGSSEETLQRVACLIDQTDPKRLVLLGDFVHHRSSFSKQLTEQLDRFFARYPGLEIVLTLGNHDRSIHQTISRWPIHVTECFPMDGVVLSHHPPDSELEQHGEPKPEPDREPEQLWVCGHIHPSYRLTGRADQLSRLPCFWFHNRCLVLPAIGDFTGTHRVKKHPGDQIWLIADERVIQVSR